MIKGLTSTKLLVGDTVLKSVLCSEI
jgi:hypothetical protein